MDIDATAVADFYRDRLYSMCLDRLTADLSVNDTTDNPLADLADNLCPGDCSGSGTCTAGGRKMPNRYVSECLKYSSIAFLVGEINREFDSPFTGIQFPIRIPQCHFTI